MPPLVLHEAILGGERLSTDVADVVPVSCLSTPSMLKAVVVEADTHRESCPTEITGVRPVTGVLAFVHHQGVHFGEALPTLSTGVGALSLLPCSIPCTLLRAKVVTEGVCCLPLITVVAPLANMLPFVALQVAAVHEGGVTFITLERPLTRVLAVVHVQLALLGIGGATHMTLVHILEVVVLLVHVKDHFEGEVLAAHITLVQRGAARLLAGGGARCPRHLAGFGHLLAAQWRLGRAAAAIFTLSQG